MAASLDEQAERDLATVTRLARSHTSAVVRFIPVRDLLAQPKPTEWLVRYVLPRKAMTTLIGAPGSFKSNIGLDIGACVAMGIDWHGRPTRKGAVFFLAGEGHHGLARRLKAWAIICGEELAEAPLFISAGAAGLTDPINAAAVAEEARRLALAANVRPELVVVDTLARNFGAGDENSAADMGQFITNLDRHIREQFDCSVVVIHHTGTMDAGRGRGSSALRAAVDVEILCERTDRTVLLKCGKSKDAAEFEPFAFEAQIVELPWTGEDGKPETSFVMRPVAVQPVTASHKGLGGNQKRAIEALQTMYAEAEANLVQDGRDPRNALIRIDAWFERAELDRFRGREVVPALEKRGLIAVEPPHVRLK